jgi:hypothetical protein
MGVWNYPKKSGPETVKEILTVNFKDGKVAKAQILDVEKARKELQKMMK